jgi:CheY-like chemotaxis protein
MIKHVLLIDDNDVDNYITEHILTKAKVAEKITVKNSALDALQFLENINGDFPEMIFLDIKMPEMDGFGFLEEYVKLFAAGKSESSVVMLTSSEDEHDIERAKAYSCVKSYQAKPLKLETVAGLF